MKTSLKDRFFILLEQKDEVIRHGFVRTKLITPNYQIIKNYPKKHIFYTIKALVVECVFNR